MKINELLEDKDPKSIYRSGMCDAFAIAIHDLTGYPIIAWGGTYYDEYSEDDAVEYCHVAVRVPFNNTWIDVDGVHSGPPDNCYFSNEVGDIQFYPMTRDEAEYVFTGEGVSEQDIQVAKDFIKSDPTLSKIVNK